MPSDMDYDEQDQSEMFDEDRINPDEGASGPDMLTFEELPDVFDVTSKVGDADLDEDETALDADELGEDDLEALSDADDEVYDDDGQDDTLADALEDDPEQNELLDADDLQAIDGLDDLEEGEAEIEYVEDTDAVAGAAPTRARVMESGGELSNEDLRELGYQGEDER